MVAAHQFAIAGEAAVAAWLWSWLENQVMVLMKAMPMGQSAGQQLISAPVATAARGHGFGMESA